MYFEGKKSEEEKKEEKEKKKDNTLPRAHSDSDH